MKNNSKKKNTNTAVLYSAALQDHFLKKNNYSLSDKIIPNTTKTQQPKLPYIHKSNKYSQKLASKQQKEIKVLEHKQKMSILPYESQALKKLKQAKSDKQKMSSYQKKLTLAQKLGIVQAPPLPLTANEWNKIQEKSKKRNDSQNICSICLENFKIQPQVILSCSHVFHMKCLNSYEKHNKVKCCPICRNRDYQSKIIDEAIKIFTMKSIIRIQRVFRGSRDRIKFYGQVVDGGYTAKSKLFNRRLIGFKMWRLSNKIKQKVKKSEQYYKKMLQNLQKKHQTEKQEILEEIVEVQRKRIMQEGSIQKYLSILGVNVQKKEEKKIDWQEVKEKGVNRPDEQCAICLTNLWSKPVYLLSCTHLFHVNCVEGFERYALPGNKNKCPCCRSSYEKKLLQMKK